MKSSLQEKLSKLLNAYSHLYDIERDVMVEGQFFPAAATYYLRDENYLISRRHVLSAVEQHEYVHFHLTGHLDARELQSLIDITRRDGLKRVQPSKEHMFSYITLIVLADTIDPEAVRLIRKTRFRKNISAYAPRLDGVSPGGPGNIFQPLLFQSGRKRSEKNSGEQFSFQRQADKIPCTQKKRKE